MPTTRLHGIYHDVLVAPDGRITWDHGWRHNTIVVDCRRLLAGFMRGAPTAALGIQGLQVGAGLDAWDPAGPPPPAQSAPALEDPFPYTVPRSALQFDYLDPANGTVVPGPTQRLQIVANLVAGVPAWPDANHVSATLREFALVAQLGGATVLVNCVRHPAITKDPLSTLERTIQLLF